MNDRARRDPETDADARPGVRMARISEVLRY